MRFCNDEKESFRAHNLTEATVEACMHRGENFIHLKPEHLWLAHSALRSPDTFFQVAARAGYDLVLSLYRSNDLARDLSSVNWMSKHMNSTERHRYFRRHLCRHRRNFPNQTLIGDYEHAHRLHRAGLRSALRRGMRVLHVTFHDVVTDGCGVVRQLLRMAGGEENDNESDLPSCRTNITTNHAAHSSINKTITERVGADVYMCLINEFRNHPEYDWMLRFEARGEIAPYDSPSDVLNGFPPHPNLRVYVKHDDHAL